MRILVIGGTRFMGPRLFRAINIVSGVSILAFAAYQIGALVK